MASYSNPLTISLNLIQQSELSETAWAKNATKTAEVSQCHKNLPDSKTTGEVALFGCPIRSGMTDYHSRRHTELIFSYLNKPPYKFGIKIGC